MMRLARFALMIAIDFAAILVVLAVVIPILGTGLEGSLAAAALVMGIGWYGRPLADVCWRWFVHGRTHGDA